MKARRAQASEPAALGWQHTSLRRTGEALRARRQALRISQEALAHQLGVAGCVVGYWEQGRRAPSLFMLAAWCQALGCGLVVQVAPPQGGLDRAPEGRGGSKPGRTPLPGCQPAISSEALAG
jgi:transcriptional regulator with XRE-family HTH domain